MRRAFVEIVGLGLAAADPADALERGERGGGRGGVGRLAVVDEDDAVLLADAFHSMWESGIGAEAVFDVLIAYVEVLANSDCGCSVVEIVEALERGPVSLVLLPEFKEVKHVVSE